MRTHVFTIVGTAMMAGCGAAIATRLGFSGMQSALFAGFAVGIVILSQAPTFALRSRIAQLEARLVASSNNAV
jgi:hypothetical protein